MRIISEANENISKLWGIPKPTGSTYRLMRYLVQEDCEEGPLLFNSVTSELVLLDTEEVALLEELPSPYISKMDELIAHHILVPEKYDEAKSINQLRSILRKITSRKEITGYSIFPTSDCNARCFYCYESSYPKLNMTSDTADKVVDFIAANCGEKKRVEIQWFGGEPTLGEDRIDQICDGLIKNGIEFTSSALSNGYLFTKDLAHKAKEKWKLKKVQISMDGTEDVYNKAKAYVNAEGNPYQRVLENIGHLIDEGIYVVVRMNMDFHNNSDLRELIDELIRRFAKKARFSAYVREIIEDTGYIPVSHSEDERRKLIADRIALNQYIEANGCGRKTIISASDALPSFRITHCMADNKQSLLINPLGQFGKCDHYSYTRLVGSIETGFDVDADEAKEWLYPDYTEWCKECQLCPICGQPDSCIGKRECSLEEKQDWINGLKKKMLSKINKEERKDEEACL